MKILRLARFHLRQFASVPYFFQLMLFTTVGAVLVQFFGYLAWDGLTPTQGWLRAGIIGMWATTVSAAGIIGFERYKGTLIYLVMGTMRPQLTLTALVSSAGTFGLGAFVVSWALWAALSGSITFTNFADPGVLLSIIGGIAALYIGSLTISLVISAIFVLTPNAITYEGLLLVPVLVASGVLMTSQPAPQISAAALIPITIPVQILFSNSASLEVLLLWLAVVLAWFALGYVLMGRALRLAYRYGTLELV